MGCSRFRDRSGWTLDMNCCRLSFIMYRYSILFPTMHSFHDYNLRQATQACHEHTIDMRAVGEMPPVSMFEVCDVMSASQVSWGIQMMHMIHDCFTNCSVHWAWSRQNGDMPTVLSQQETAATTHVASVLVFILKGTRPSTKVFRRQGYGDRFVGMEHVYELGYVHVHFFVHGLRIL